MRITAVANSLSSAISWVVRDYDPREASACVVLEVDEKGNGSLSYLGSSYLRCRFDITYADFTGEQDTSACIMLEGQYLKRLAGVLGKDTVTLEKDLGSASSEVTLKTPSSSLTLPQVDVKVPARPQFSVLGEVDDNETLDYVQRLSRLCDTDRTGSMVFAGAVDIGLEGEGQDACLSLFATDCYALSQVHLPFVETESTDADALAAFRRNHVLLPYATASKLSPTKWATAPLVLIGEVCAGQPVRIGFDFPDGRVALFPLLDGSPFNGVDAMRKKALTGVDNRLTVDTSELLSAVKTVSSLSWSETQISLLLDKDGITVSDPAGANKVQVAAEGDAHSTTVSFNRGVFTEAFSPVSTKKVRLKWSSTSPIFVLSPVSPEGHEVSSVFIIVQQVV